MACGSPCGGHGVRHSLLVETKALGLGLKFECQIELVGSVMHMALVRQQLNLVAASGFRVIEDALHEGSGDSSAAMRNVDDDCFNERRGLTVVGEIGQQKQGGRPSGHPVLVGK